MDEGVFKRIVAWQCSGMVYYFLFVSHVLHEHLGEIPLADLKPLVWAFENAEFFFVDGVNISVPSSCFQHIQSRIIAQNISHYFSDGGVWHFSFGVEAL